MLKAAKLIIVNDENKYLILERNNHPMFGNEADLPGGTVEAGESPLGAMVREVYEEAGIVIDPQKVTLLYQGSDYSRHGTQYTLYAIRTVETPEVKLSWEHTSYRWLDRETFLKELISNNDTYLHMAHDVLTKNPNL